jgi:uncharacterized damage-inducible protein DinB
VSSTDALAALLSQLRDVVAELPAEIYVARPAPAVSGSVGEHIRHCLDHVSAFTSALAGDELSYDHRLRGTRVESDPTTALGEIDRLAKRLDHLPPRRLDRPVDLRSLVEATGPAHVLRSTLGRELAFVVQHTVHHCALVALLLAWQGHQVPHGFGVAPSTLRARRCDRVGMTVVMSEAGPATVRDRDFDRADPTGLPGPDLAAGSAS